jgi:hypothetical protein
MVTEIRAPKRRCAECRSIVRTSWAIVEGVEIVRCLVCRKYKVVGDDRWIPASPDAYERLKERAATVHPEMTKPKPRLDREALLALLRTNPLDPELGWRDCDGGDAMACPWCSASLKRTTRLKGLFLGLTLLCCPACRRIAFREDQASTEGGREWNGLDRMDLVPKLEATAEAIRRHQHFTGEGADDPRLWTQIG